MTGLLTDAPPDEPRSRRLHAREQRAVASLGAALDDLVGTPPGNTGAWLARLVRRIRPRRHDPVATAAARIRALTAQLAARPEAAAAFGAHLCELLASRMHRMLYADAGMLASEGFFGGLARRALASLLPPAVDDHYLRDLIDEVFEHPRDHEWLAAVPVEDWDALLRALGVDGEAFAPARRRCYHELLEALRLSAVRLAALATDNELLRYLPALVRHESPFLAQAGEVAGFIRRHAEGGDAGADDGHLEVLLEQCDSYVDTVRRRSREAGVAVNLVYLLSRIERVIERIRLLRHLVAPALAEVPPADADAARAAQAADPARAAQAADPAAAARARAIGFFLVLVRQEKRRNSLRDLVRGSSELLARRVTEQASRSGEHYIAASRGEFVELYRAAAGAGLVIAVMALLKIFITRLDLPLAWEGLAFSLNYGLGFVLIHVLHFTIATKQPAMTAATLAASLDGRQGREARLDALAGLAAEVSRSQWVSIAGNVVVTMITAFAIALVGDRLLGWRPIDPAKAAHLLHDLHPWQSLALLHAAIAGVYLFLSGLISGYYDNLSLYHRVPQRLQRVRVLRTLLGTQRLARLADYVEHNLGALAGNFLFGCMLGLTPIVGEFLGLPLDIRHVAFAAANFAYGLETLQFQVSHWTVLVSLAGVLLIGLVNLLVSFSLALKVALRSRGITREQTEGLWARVIARFVHRPRDFFLPPVGERAAT